MAVTCGRLSRYLSWCVRASLHRRRPSLSASTQRGIATARPPAAAVDSSADISISSLSEMIEATLDKQRDKVGGERGREWVHRNASDELRISGDTFIVTEWVCRKRRVTPLR